MFCSVGYVRKHTQAVTRTRNFYKLRTAFVPISGTYVRLLRPWHNTRGTGIPWNKSRVRVRARVQHSCIVSLGIRLNSLIPRWHFQVHCLHIFVLSSTIATRRVVQTLLRSELLLEVRFFAVFLWNGQIINSLLLTRMKKVWRSAHNEMNSEQLCLPVFIKDITQIF